MTIASDDGISDDEGSGDTAPADRLHEEALRHHQVGRKDIARGAYEKALAQDPDRAETHINLGLLLYEAGDVEQAISHLRRATVLRPDLSLAHFNLGIALSSQGQFQDGEEAFRRALAIDETLASAYFLLGNILVDREENDEAAEHYRRAIELQPELREANIRLAQVFLKRGMVEESLETARKFVAQHPDHASAHRFLIYNMLFSEQVTATALFESHVAWAKRHCAAGTSDHPGFSNVPDPDRRLRVGYFSGNFGNDQIGHLIEPILAHHDFSAVASTCYDGGDGEESTRTRLHDLADEWRPIGRLSDSDVVRLVREDGIDILVDLWGHLRGSRIEIVAARPAPIQVSFIGYPGTTGLASVDYRFTDALADPPGTSDRYYTEKLVRLPNSLWCWAPLRDMPEPNRLPALERGYLTFASFNNCIKVTMGTMKLWAEVLKAIPESRLVMVTYPEGEARERVRGIFSENGVSPERLQFYGWLRLDEYHAIHRQVDIALDPFPCNGGATTCESLWLGVPVISLAGEAFLSRAGVSILTAAGLTQFIARSHAEYVAIASHCAKHLADLNRLRLEMRQHLRNSSLTDAETYTSNLEAEYRRMWRAWCDGHAARSTGNSR